MNQFFWFFCFVPIYVGAQTIERHPIDIIYGNEVIHAEHQVVVSSQKKVAVIPIERSLPELAPNIVVGAGGKVPSYIDENNIAKREQVIYDEVNRRTEEAPFTVLFTGNIPEAIQQKRLRMMPEIGVLGGQAGGAVNGQVDVGSFSPVGATDTTTNKNASAEEVEKLNALIGG